MSRQKSSRDLRRSVRNAGNERKGQKDLPRLTGKVLMSREGHIFVRVENDPDDIYVKSSKTKNALHGDIVLVALTKEKVGNKSREGEVLSIVERSTKPFVGVLHFVGSQVWLLMQSKTMPYDIELDQQQALQMGGKTGMKAAVVVDSFERYATSPKGHVVDVLGMPGENDTEMHAILSEFGLPYRFEPEVENAADKISEEITKKDLKGRKDFRDTLTFTIDPFDAKDFDDALSFRPLPNGNYEVGVHIADVSYYVTPGTAVDKEAQERGTSVYLVDRTVPMLPEKLCNKLCSLRQDEDKLTFSAVFEITPQAKVESQWIGRTVICSNRRMDYEQAQAVIDAGKANDEVEEAILKLNELALIFRKKRFSAGAMSFDRPEMKVICDEKGKPIDVRQTESTESHWLIEEFMLLANRTVAEFIATDGKMNGTASKKAKTFVYRIHDEPNMEKVSNLREYAAGFGYQMAEAEGGKSVAKALNGLLSSAKDRPEFSALQIMALRSMAKAKYSTENIGHYGLAFKFYTHFTSPIRRYPDTMVHRLLSLYLDGADSQSRDYYEQQCVHATEREILAAEAERASIKYKLVEFMQDKIGQEFDGHVSGCTEWGMYVEVEPTKIEGMVPLRTIKQDFFDFDEAHCRLIGRRTGKVFNLGDPVRIRVKSTSLEQKLLDYELVETAQESVPEPQTEMKHSSRKAMVKEAIKKSKKIAEAKNSHKKRK
ncbi:MAG: ribonuclease R [Bacteroidales bacterium]|nr:ribonuclease R [Bacteroidales bacterium]